jgi:site-specific DNA-methyltransferase (adenine-specific)
MKNRHPTVKPLKLMSYLITLGSRSDDLVLDPFAGTCTTGMAAKMLGREWLMIEIDEEWCRIGQRRIDAVERKLL